MKIAYDGKRAVQNLTGLGNYSRLIIGSIAREFPDDTLTLFAPRDRPCPRLIPIRELPNVRMRFPARAPLGKAIWRTCGITRELATGEYDIYHGLSNELPLNIRRAHIPTVLTMHDVIYRRMPECYTAADRLIYDIKYGASCRAATRIIAISECTKRDIIHYYGIDADRIDVIYQGVDSQFTPPPADAVQEVRNTYGLTARYLLQVGSIETRKNALLSVRALAALPSSLELLLVGRATPYLRLLLKEASELGVAHRLRVLHNVPFAHLPALYGGAAAALYPSRYEGFGLPVLEALSCGTPCVAATGSCLEEAGGDAALYVSPDDPRALTHAVETILSGSADTAAMRARGLRHAARFDNARVASATRDVYARALQEHSAP